MCVNRGGQGPNRFEAPAEHQGDGGGFMPVCWLTIPGSIPAPGAALLGLKFHPVTQEVNSIGYNDPSNLPPVQMAFGF